MNVEHKIEPNEAFAPEGTDAPQPEAAAAPEQAVEKFNTSLLATGFGPLHEYLRSSSAVAKALTDIAGIADRASIRAARKLHRQLSRVEPSVTMIGQVKAGKTSLVNAMVGWPDLLPADVNPWTSVVTSLHVSPRPQVAGTRASFRFFDEDEWTRLLERGGRIGELAGRAGAEDEVQKVTAQLEAMREKSRRRLGRKFEMLMGQEHAYGYFDSELIQRYVCLGDDFESDTETSNAQGRFADITRSAALYLQREEFPVDFCIRDTPGVNDTFMMREQITIRAIRESRMCVVVLSAHQALSTVDLALIRLISNLPSREVMIFVNRIDELSDPANQVPEIEQSIRKTLKDHQGPADADIIFGSAYWANHVLRGAIGELSESSRAALFNWAEAALREDGEDPSVEDMVWTLSGLPKLLEAVSNRVVEGEGREVIAKTARAAMNLLSGVTTAEHMVSKRVGSGTGEPLDRKLIPAELDRVEAEARERLEREFATIRQGFLTRLERSHQSFLERATSSLIKHLDEYGDSEVWHYDATGLRVLLRSAFQVFARGAQKTCQSVLLQTTADIREIYLRAFSVPDGGFRLEAPPAPRIPAPVMLGQTIALDMSSGWWSRWWRRRKGYGSFAKDFAEIIKAETDPIVEALKTDNVNAVLAEARKIQNEFLASQREILTSLAAEPETGMDELAGFSESKATKQKAETIKTTRALLEQFID